MRQGDGVLHIFKEKYFNTKREMSILLRLSFFFFTLM